jgi:hypothetical protein
MNSGSANKSSTIFETFALYYRDIAKVILSPNNQ